MKTKTTYPKCDGRKKLREFGHVAAGDCFCCGATGIVMIDITAEIKKLDATTVKKADWIMSATPSAYKNLSYNQLLSIMTFSCSGGGVMKVYPELKNSFESNGRDAFNFAQDKKRSEWEEKNRLN